MKNLFSHLILIICILGYHSHSGFAQETPLPGQLIITEFMSNPSAVSDTKGEWFEILNISDKIISLNNLILSDLGSNKHKISSDSSILIEPGAYLIMARNGDSAENGGINPDYVYSNFSLSNSEDEITISLESGTLICEIGYDKSWPLYPGATCELSPGFNLIGNINDSQYWHPATNTYGTGDLGTPGKVNSSSTFTLLNDNLEVFDVFPNPTTGPVSIRLRLLVPQYVSINLINLLGQSKTLFRQDVNGTVLIPLSISHMKPGLYWIEMNAGGKSLLQKIVLQ